MKSRRLLHALVAIVFILILVAGCAPAQTGPVSSTTSSTISPAAKPIVWRLSDWGMPRGFADPYVWWAAEVEKRTQGRMKVEIYWGGTLAAADQVVQLMQKGAFEMGIINPEYYTSQLPTLTIGAQYLLTDDMLTISKVHADYCALPEVQSELAKWNLKFMMSVPVVSCEIIGSKTITSLADFEGLRLRATASQAPIVNLLGGVPLDIEPADFQTSAQKGLVDGFIFSPDEIVSYDIMSYMRYYTRVGFGCLAWTIVANQDAYNKLPADIQAILLNLTTTDYYTSGIGEKAYDATAHDMQKITDAGCTVSSLPPVEKAWMAEVAGQPRFDAWIKDMQGKGLPGEKLMEFYRTKIEQY